MPQKLLDDLIEARLDAAVVALPIFEPTLEQVTLFEEEFVLVRPPEDAGKPVPNSMALREMRLLPLEEGHSFREQALSYCKTTTSPPRDLMAGSSPSTLVQMVGAGIGVTRIPQMTVAIETRAATVSVDSLAHPRPSRQIGMIWRKTNPLAHQLIAISEIVREVAANTMS